MRAAERGKSAIILSAEDDRGGQESTGRPLEQGKIRNEQQEAAGVEDQGFTFPAFSTLESPQEAKNKIYHLQKRIFGLPLLHFRIPIQVFALSLILYFAKKAC
jgi:hypothetical protein